MLKLKYLFDNRDLVMMILKNWDYDKGSLELLEYYRISSNAVYPFKCDGEVLILRFAPVEEKHLSNVMSEMAFIRFLKTKGYSALETVPTKIGEECITCDTPWGSYYAVVFKRVKGKQLGNITYTAEIARRHGQFLGELHKLSSTYEPRGHKHWSWDEVLEWIGEVLVQDEKNHQAALKELKTLKQYFTSCTVSDDNYGLVHYDFELDNVFYDDNTHTMSAIDFEDAMYHWYVMDIVQALGSIKDELGEKDYSNLEKEFLIGYQKVRKLRDDELAKIPACKRFAHLFSYTKIVVSSKESWDNEPEWLQQLRQKLEVSLQKSRNSFFV